MRRSGRVANGALIDCVRALDQNDPQAIIHRRTGTTMRRIFYRLLFAGLLIGALPTQPARALDGKDVADKLITTVVIGGATMAGIPPPSPEQVAFMKEMVGCIIDGSSVVDCGKQSIIK